MPSTYFNFKKMEEKEYITEEKKKVLLEELDQLKRVKRKEIAEQLEYAKSLGDLSENAEYHEARDLQGLVEDRINKIENILKNAVLVSTQHTDKVVVGSKVVVLKSGSDKEVEYTVVGGEESDITEGKISVHSPFGEAILGKKKGDSFTVEAPAGSVTYKVIEIK